MSFFECVILVVRVLGSERLIALNIKIIVRSAAATDSAVYVEMKVLGNHFFTVSVFELVIFNLSTIGYRGFDWLFLIIKKWERS